VRGDTGEGGELLFYFGGPEPAAVMAVTSLEPDRHVGWRCVRGPEDWVGTNFSFQLEPTPEETVLLFTNADWREPVEFMHHCSTKWGYHLLGLKAGLEGGKATPFPTSSPSAPAGTEARRGRGLPGAGRPEPRVTGSGFAALRKPGQDRAAYIDTHDKDWDVHMASLRNYVARQP
jgi:hypothetical protein